MKKNLLNNLHSQVAGMQNFGHEHLCPGVSISAIARPEPYGEISLIFVPFLLGRTTKFKHFTK